MSTTDNNTFSLERFCRLAKSEFILNKKHYLQFSLAAIGTFLAIAVLISINAISNINEHKELAMMGGEDVMVDHNISVMDTTMPYSIMYIALAGWLISIALTVTGSLTFSSLSSKRQRITTLMQPASQFEKFLLRFLIYTVGGTIIILLGALIGLTTIHLSFGGATYIFETFTDFIHSVEYSGWILFIVVLLVLLGNSVYTLGSSLWPKLSWLKTWLVMMVIEWVFAILLFAGIFSNFNFDDFFRIFDNEALLLTIAITVLLLLNIGCWIAAWFRFKNTQIVQRFMKK